MYARLCDTFHSDPRVLAAGDEAVGFWARSYSYCAAYLTDGHFTRAMARSLAHPGRKLDPLAAKLVKAGLWEPHASGDGWVLPDYLRHNLSRGENDARKAALSAKRAEAGRKGAQKRWEGRDPANAKDHGTGSPGPAAASDGNVDGKLP